MSRNDDTSGTSIFLPSTAFISPNHNPPNPTSKAIGFDGINPSAQPLSPHQLTTLNPSHHQGYRSSSSSKPLVSPIKATMPTPESAAFLAKKPTVAPTYEGVDFEDNVAVHNARDAIIREQWVRSMMSRLVGEELGKCYAREGVNHLEKCGVLREKYFELLKERKIKGYLFQEKNHFGGEKA